MDQTKIERGRRQEGEKGTIKNSCAGSREGGSWPGGAGAQDPAHVAQPGPAPSVVQLPHSGPYHEVSPALRLCEYKWVLSLQSKTVVCSLCAVYWKSYLISFHFSICLGSNCTDIRALSVF